MSIAARAGLRLPAEPRYKLDEDSKSGNKGPDNTGNNKGSGNTGNEEADVQNCKLAVISNDAARQLAVGEQCKTGGCSKCAP